MLQPTKALQQLKGTRTEQHKSLLSALRGWRRGAGEEIPQSAAAVTQTLRKGIDKSLDWVYTYVSHAQITTTTGIFLWRPNNSWKRHRG